VQNSISGRRWTIVRLVPAIAIGLAVPLPALDGQPGMHDPSTVVVERGRYYAYGTGAGLPISVSDDGVSNRLTLKRGAHVIRGAIINAGGATDFCARLLDAGDQPIRSITVELPAEGR
jgi:hypothetical protein